MRFGSSRTKWLAIAYLIALASVSTSMLAFKMRGFAPLLLIGFLVHALYGLSVFADKRADTGFLRKLGLLSWALAPVLMLALIFAMFPGLLEALMSNKIAATQ